MTPPIRILMIDDDEEDYILTRDIVAEIDHQKYTLDWISSYEEGLKQTGKGKYDVYLVDYRLGTATGTQLIKEAIYNGCREPLILLTGQNNVEVDNEALTAGAADYLVKGTLSARSLESSIRYSIAHANHLKEISALNEQLEERVKERTLILQEAVDELNQTKRELSNALQKEKELSDLKTRFVSMASHEFRTPLAAILSSLSLIRQYGELNEKEKQLKHIEKIKTSVSNLTDIINDVLSVSKLEEGKILVSPEKLNAEKTVSELIAELQGITKQDQKIQYHHSGNKEVFLDKKIFRHILFNLCSNAIKFSAEGKSIEVKTEMDAQFIRLSVRDRGIGISSEDQKHLFERFFRATNATNIQGTGLGLNIVKKYVEILNGKIEFKSELEEGTTFTVTLPNIPIAEKAK